MTGGTFSAQTDDGPIGGWQDGEGPDVILLHGGPGLSDYTYLLDGECSGWRRTRYQQRGLEPSSRSGPFTVERHVADAIAVIDHLSITDVVVVGHSWGGHLALQLALAEPRVAGVVVVDGLGVIGDGGAISLGQELRERLPAAVRKEVDEIDELLSGPAASDELALQSLRLLWPSYFGDPSTADPLPDDVRLCLECSNETFGSAMEELADDRFAHRLGSLNVPVAMVLGALSPMPVAVGQEAARYIRGCEVEVIAGAGHLPSVEEPGCLARALGRVRQRIAEG